MPVRYSIRKVASYVLGPSSSSSFSTKRKNTRRRGLLVQQQQQIGAAAGRCRDGEYYDTNKTRKKSKVLLKDIRSSLLERWKLQIQRLLLKIQIKRDIILASSSSWLSRRICLFIILGMSCFFLFHIVLVFIIPLKMTRIRALRRPQNNQISKDDPRLLVLERYYSHVHPITMRYMDPSDETYHHNHIRPVPLPLPGHYVYSTTKHRRRIREWTEHDRANQAQLWDDEWYDSESVRPFSPYDNMPECEPMHPWQKIQYPTCNVMHEQHLDDLDNGKFLSSGFFRLTFEIHGMEDEPIAMKTLRNDRDFTPNLMERHRVDALIYERTTASPWIVDIFGYCGYSGLFEYAAGGTLLDFIQDINNGRRPPLSRIQKLSLAIQAANGITDLHTNNKDSINGYSSMVHADVFLNQFVWSENRYKLNDFNRGHLMWWNMERNETCPYLWLGGNAGNFRSPEEFKEEWQTEKIDVFSLGNIIYTIITGNLPFEEQEMDLNDAQEMVKNGILPILKDNFIRSDHPIDRVLVKAMEMCFEYDWRQRARAYQVRNLLMNEMDEEFVLYNNRHRQRQ